MTVEALFSTLFWSAATILLYALSKALHRRLPHMLLSPLIVTPALLIAMAIALHAQYAQYIRATHWLMALLGPATVAFAIPIYEQRHVIRRYWPALAVGIVVGSLTALASAWALASLVSVDGALRLSLLPRSISTPFAMAVSADIGGVPDLTAVFVVVTGIAGAAIGEAMLRFMPVRSAFARGAAFGMAAHGAGVARASQIGGEEGSIAGLVMVLVGLANVLLAPLLQRALS